MVMKKRLVLCIKIFIVFIMLLLINFMSVSASENNKSLKLDFQVIQNNLQSKIEKNNQEVSINIHSKKNSENPYLYLYQSKSYNWTNYQGISIYLENKSNEKQNINFQIESSLQNKFNLNTDAKIFLQNSESNVYREGKMTYSNLEIPGKFKGKIYITFDNFINGANKSVLSKKELKSITSWGVNIIPLNESESNIVLNKIELLGGSSLNIINLLKDIKVKGNYSVQIPVVGESIESYVAEGNGKIKLSLSKQYEGITLNEHGLLTVNDKAREEDIFLKININNEINYEKIITLSHSWSFNKVDKDGVPYKLLPPDKSPTVNEINKFIFLDKSMVLVRICLITTCFICLMLYVKWKH